MHDSQQNVFLHVQRACACTREKQQYHARLRLSDMWVAHNKMELMPKHRLLECADRMQCHQAP